MKHTKLFLLIFLLFLLVPKIKSQRLQKIKQSGKIHASFTESSLNTINYKLAVEFARFLHVDLVIEESTWNDNFSRDGQIQENYQTDPSISYTPDALKKSDFICGSIYMLDWRKKFFDYAGILDMSDLLVIPKNANITSYSQLVGKRIAFMKNSTYEINIQSISKTLTGNITFIRTDSEEESSKMMQNKLADGFISVSYLALEFVKNNPDYQIAFPVAPLKKIGWAVEKGNNELKKEIDNFFETIKGNGKLDDLFIESYGINYDKYLEILNAYSIANQQSSNVRDLDKILKSGKLIVGLREETMIYNPNKPQFNQMLVEQFANYLGVKLEIVIIPSVSKFFETENGEILKDSTYTPEWMKRIDIAADILVPLEWRKNKIDIVDFIPYAMVVIGNKNHKITGVSDLINYEGVVSKGSITEDILVDNGVTKFHYRNSDFLLDVIEKKADYMIGSNAIFELNKYPNLEAKFVIGNIGKDGWGMKRNTPKLKQKLIEFLQYSKQIGLLDQYFKIQTGMTLQESENYFTSLYQTYQTGVFPFVKYGSEAGLPQEDILSIFQDKDGYIWFGTQTGAAKYNGREMITFETDTNFAHNSIFDIDQDSTGIIYFASQRGIFYIKNNKLAKISTGRSFKKIFIDRQNYKWFFGNDGIVQITRKGKLRFFNDENLNLPLNINDITQAKDKDYMFLASSEGLYYINHVEKSYKLSDEYSYCAFIDEANQLWISTEKGIYLKNQPWTNKNLGIKLNTQLNIPENIIIKDIHQTKDGSIWLISDFKIYQIITTIQKPIVYDKNIGLGNDLIHSFLEDREGNLWVGLKGGVAKLNGKSLRSLYPSLITSHVQSILHDSEDRVWISQNGMLYYFKDQLNKFNSDFSNTDKTFAVTETKNKNILIASNSGLFLYDQKSLKLIKKRIFSQQIKHVNLVFSSNDGQIFITTGIDGTVSYLKSFSSPIVILSNHLTQNIRQLIDFEGDIIGANTNGLIYFDERDFSILYDLENNSVTSLCVDDDVLWVGTENGFAIFVNEEVHFLDIKLPNNVINAIHKAVDNTYLWIGTNKGLVYYNKTTGKVEFIIDTSSGLSGNEIATNGLVIDKKGLLWIATYHGISTFDIKKKNTKKYTPDCKIEKIWLNGQLVENIEETLRYDQNNITFELLGLSFKDEEAVEYDFFLKGLENDYAASQGTDYKAQYTNLPPGNYTFTYRTKGKDDIWSYYKQISFKIEKPYWKQIWFIILSILTFILIFYFLIKWRHHALMKKNEHLEQMVAKRTQQLQEQTNEILEKNEELQQQREKILTQRDEITLQKESAETQRDEIAQQRKDMIDSIYYASRIQTAILPPGKYIDKTFPQHFILLKPRDIVSGDYYWVNQVGDTAIVVAADSTGHGVPGAFMSLLGAAFLSDIVKEGAIEFTASNILDRLRRHLITALHQESGDNDTKDGMDVAILVINIKTNELQYAGAYNPLYLVRNNELIEYKANRMPIGMSDFLDVNFTNHRIKLQENDNLYVFSDGYIDQFGGPKEKKFKSKPFKEYLLSIQNKSMIQQRELLDKNIEDWRGETEQIDDILVIGIKI